MLFYVLALVGEDILNIEKYSEKFPITLKCHILVELYI